MAVTYITLTHNADLSDDLRADPVDPVFTAKRLSSAFSKMAIGAASAKFDLQVEGGDGAKAAGQLVLSTSVATDTAQVMGELFTEVLLAPANANEFQEGDDDSETAANLAAAINAHPNLANCVEAVATATVIDITAAQPGPLGNLVELLSSGGILNSGANLAGGVAPTPKLHRCGLV